MTEKLKVTREQADALSFLKISSDLIAMKALAEDEDDRSEPYKKTLGQLTLYQLGQALRIGYEVESGYKLGGWVFDEGTKRVDRIIEIRNHSVLIEGGSLIGHGYLRHATPEEIKAEQERSSVGGDWS